MNELYPIFLKAHRLKILIIGGGYVGLEKLTFLLKSSPYAKVTVISKEFIPETMRLINKHGLSVIQKPYASLDISGYNIIVGATNDKVVNEQIYHDARQKGILVNIADNPPLCDFYMGGIVTKGDLKLAISTNGKSPTMAKRLRQFFESTIPDNIQDLLENLHIYRKKLTGDFDYKVEHLNHLTESLITQNKLHQ